MLALSVAWVSACGAADGIPPGTDPDAGMDPVNLLVLTADPDAVVQVERGATGSFAFVLSDRDGVPVEGALVRFAIVGRANDASLESTESNTDSEGRVTGTIVGASTESSFQVRASTEGADPAYIDVSVSDTGFGSMNVDVAYAGARPITDFVVRLFSGMHCDDLESMTPPDRYERMRRSDGTTTFDGLPAGIAYAVLAQGQDRDRVVLARACADGFTIVANDTAATSLALEDTPAHAAGSYNVDFTFASTSPGERVAEAIQTTAGRYFTDDGASYVLDQVAAIYTRAGETEAAVQFEEFREAQYLDTHLSSYMAEHALGPAAALAAIGELASAGVNDVGVRAVLTVPESGMLARDAFAFTAFDARTDGIAFPISMDRVPPPMILSQGTYSSTVAAIQFESIDLSLPLGSLARAYVEGAAGMDLRPAIIAAAACEGMTSWWTDGGFDTNVLDAATLQQSCENAVEYIADATLVSLANLDLSARALHLSGSASVHDRDRDGAVDEIGTSALDGIWRPVGATTGIPADMHISAVRSSTRMSSPLR